MRTLPLLLLLLATATVSAAPPPPPAVPSEVPPQIVVTQPGVKLTLLAEHPDLVTPTGVDVDAQGRIWVVACHTHFRPEGYAGPAHDEILVFDRAGKNRRVFYAKTAATMHLELGPDGWVYLAERGRLLRVRDADGDGVGDLEENLATLETVADYPHNGLSGMAWHPDGSLLFSLGENFGKDWTLTARDGTHVSGRGEGGIFRCTADGRELRRLARGFWNPCGLVVRRDGEIFAADNDPGSRPPCRLLNIVEGADYGFQWVYGSSPVHPFVAWNGELRGTLGMVQRVGEAPCAVVELGVGLLIPSWSEHRIDYFPLARKGAGFSAGRIELLHGGDYFRPVSLARGLDGAFYLTDWVFSSYPVHARGRLWRLEIDRKQAAWVQARREPATSEAHAAAGLRTGRTHVTVPRLFTLARGADAFLSDAALTALAREPWTVETLRALSAADRVWALVALRRTDLQEEKWVRALLEDQDPEVRFESLRWIADGVLTGFCADVERLLQDPRLDFRLFEAALAAWNTLRGEPGAGVTQPDVLLDRITAPDTPARLKGYALRLAPPGDRRLTLPLLRTFLDAGEPSLALEVVRTLAARPAGAEERALLAEIAARGTHPAALRAEAVAALSTSPEPAHRASLLRLAESAVPTVRDEARRALRVAGLDPAFQPVADRPPPDATAAWLARLDALPGIADPEAGRRLFFHPQLALCATCHRHSGRGAVVGPDLSLIGRQGDRTALLRSLLEPQRDIAPQYHPTALELRDGTTFTGLLLRAASSEVYRDPTGQERTFQPADILRRTELPTSLMPPGLVAALTDSEVRDLLAFLQGAPRGAPVYPVEFARSGITAAWSTYARVLTFGKGQTLALLDDGCTLTRPEWRAVVDDVPKVRVSFDAVDGDADPRHVGKGYHGTTIGIPSSVNQGGKRGVAFNNQVAIVRGLECCHGSVAAAPTIARGLEWVVEQHAAQRITTVNLAPVDDQEHAGPVPSEIDAPLLRLRALGIWVSAPAGNHHFTRGISWPASQPACFAIGAVVPDRDVVHLDRHAKVDLLVPARATSSSNAIACGAAMILREAVERSGYDWRADGPTLPEALMKILQKTGQPVHDPATGLTFPRLDLMAALRHVRTPTEP